MYLKTIMYVLTTVAIPAAALLSGQATTTRYGGGSGGACGCGMNGGWEWQLGMGPGVYTAAGSPALFDTTKSGSSWCGGGCGTCYKLTSTGTSVTKGDGAPGRSIIVMLTNLCPSSGNEQWCPAAGSKNAYGFGYHFDIMANGIVFGDNVVVDFVQVNCPASASSRWPSCQCSSMVSPPVVLQPSVSTHAAQTTTTSLQQSKSSTGPPQLETQPPSDPEVCFAVAT